MSAEHQNTRYWKKQLIKLIVNRLRNGDFLVDDKDQATDAERQRIHNAEDRLANELSNRYRLKK